MEMKLSALWFPVVAALAFAQYQRAQLLVSVLSFVQRR